MKRTIKISEARARLFELADFVASSGSNVVEIERRGVAERVALVSAEHLRFLETFHQEALKRNDDGWKLAGSIELVDPTDDVESVLRDIRAEQNRLYEEKLDRIFVDD